jgi:hypothetical protein
MSSNTITITAETLTALMTKAATQAAQAATQALLASLAEQGLGAPVAATAETVVEEAAEEVEPSKVTRPSKAERKKANDARAIWMRSIGVVASGQAWEAAKEGELNPAKLKAMNADDGLVFKAPTAKKAAAKKAPAKKAAKATEAKATEAKATEAKPARGRDAQGRFLKAEEVAEAPTRNERALAAIDDLSSAGLTDEQIVMALEAVGLA